MVSSFRFTITFIDTATDKEVAVLRSDSLTGVKRQIMRHIYPTKAYTGTGWEVVYINDVEFSTHDGLEKLRAIEDGGTWIDRETFEERGIDFDIWHDEYLTDEERAFFDKLKVH